MLLRDLAPSSCPHKLESVLCKFLSRHAGTNKQHIFGLTCDGDGLRGNQNFSLSPFPLLHYKLQAPPFTSLNVTHLFKTHDVAQDA